MPVLVLRAETAETEPKMAHRDCARVGEALTGRGAVADEQSAQLFLAQAAQHLLIELLLLARRRSSSRIDGW